MVKQCQCPRAWQLPVLWPVGLKTEAPDCLMNPGQGWDLPDTATRRPGPLSRVLVLNQWTPLTIPNLGKGWVTQCFCSCVCLDNSAIVFRIMSCCVCVLVYPVWVNGLFCNYFVSIFAVKGPYWLLRFQEKCVNALFRKLPCCLIGSDYCTFTPE